MSITGKHIVFCKKIRSIKGLTTTGNETLLKAGKFEMGEDEVKCAENAFQNEASWPSAHVLLSNTIAHDCE